MNFNAYSDFDNATRLHYTLAARPTLVQVCAHPVVDPRPACMTLRVTVCSHKPLNLAP
jgi:hypothetical protein